MTNALYTYLLETGSFAINCLKKKIMKSHYPKYVSSILTLVGLLGLQGCLDVSNASATEEFDTKRALERARLYDARVVRDAFGVPHVYGKRDVDTAFGLAYAQAEDNIRNIEQSFKFARGKMGESTGREGAKTDYLIAAMQVRETFDKKYESDLSENVRAVLDAYADGINFYCAEQKNRCTEGFAPLLGREVASAPKTRGPFVFGLGSVLADIFSEKPAGDAGDSVEPGSAMLNEEAPPGDLYSAYVGVDTSIVGSNAIAVSPNRSSDGYTRLYSNAHQPFVGPTALYEARVRSDEGWDIYGAFVSGSPFAIFGANSELAWTITVSRPDLIDVYEMQVNDPEEPTQYKLDGQWRDLEISTVAIKVKIWGPFKTTVKRKVYHSVHGPVFDTPNGWFAVSFAGYGDIQSMEQLYAMNKAKNQAQWLNAMKRQGVAAFNIVYADKLGNIAYYYNARAPKRSPEWDWSKIAPGDRSDLLWNGVWPFGSMPQIENPPSGFVVSANHDPFHVTGSKDNLNPADYPSHMGVVNETSNRGLRIFRLFDNDSEISRDDILKYKMDGRYAKDSYLMVLLEKLVTDPNILQTAEFREAIALLKSWDGDTNLESRAAALATRVGHLLLGIQLNPTKTKGELSDPVEALRQAIKELKKGFGRIDPTWGEVNRLIRGDVDLPIRGGPDVLRAVYSTDNPKDGPMAAVAGDSLQYLVEWDADGKMHIESIYHFGANKIDENSQHYADQATLFAAEKFRVPPMTLEQVVAEATSDYSPGMNGRESER